MENTQEYIDFILSDEFKNICNLSDRQISEMEYNFIDKIFPVTNIMWENNHFVIDIKKLRESEHFETVQNAMYISLEIFCRFFRILETGMEENYFQELVKFKMNVGLILRSLIYHGLYINAQLLCFRFSRFRIEFKDLKSPNTVWEKIFYSCVKEIEDCGLEYREPSISTKYI